MTFRWDLFNDLPLVAILRGFDPRQITPLCDTLIESGWKNLEITMNSRDAAGQIAEAARRAGSRMNIGAGTVLTTRDLDAALAAGAAFVVTPVVNADVIRACRQNDVPVMPGAFSPTEAAAAWDLGAALVKLFPAEFLGPAFIKSIKAPLPWIKLLPTGGVDVSRIQPYMAAGADGFGIGTPLLNPQRIADQDWPWLKRRSLEFQTAFREAAAD